MGQILLILIGLVLNVEAAPVSTNLKIAFQFALARSETIASQEKLVLIAEERFSQAKGGILPNLTFNASYTIQDQPADPLASTFFPRYQPEAKLTLRQPVFRGLREFAVLRQTKNLIESEKYARENAIRLLYNDVAKTYHAVLASEENFHNISEQIKIYDERIDELSRRVREGTSNQTDLLAVQASRATVQSQLLTAQSLVSASREAFVFLTALPNETKLNPISDLQPNPKSLEEYLKGIDQRPDVLTSKERIQAANEQSRIAKGAHAPSIDLLGNYYLRRQSDIYRGIDWDIQASLSFPIFAGGTISAQVKEAAFQRERAELELSRLRRQSEQEIRTLYNDYVSGLGSVKALKESLQLSEKNYQLLKRDFRRGLARNLDVLQALISANEIRRELVRVRFLVQDRWIELNTAAGQSLYKEGT